MRGASVDERTPLAHSAWKRTVTGMVPRARSAMAENAGGEIGDRRLIAYYTSGGTTLGRGAITAHIRPTIGYSDTDTGPIASIRDIHRGTALAGQ